MEPDIAASPKRGWPVHRIVLVTLFAVFCITWGPYLSCVAWLHSHPFFLEKPVSVVSPDGDRSFEATLDGTLRIVRNSSETTLHSNRVSTRTFRRVSAKWKNQTTVEVSAAIRYPFKVKEMVVLWNSQTGRFAGNLSDD